MTISKLRILNDAFVALNENTIESVDDTSKKSRVLKSLYDSLYRRLLGEMQWSFTIRNAYLRRRDYFDVNRKYPIPATDSEWLRTSGSDRFYFGASNGLPILDGSWRLSGAGPGERPSSDVDPKVFQLDILDPPFEIPGYEYSYSFPAIDGCVSPAPFGHSNVAFQPGDFSQTFLITPDCDIAPWPPVELPRLNNRGQFFHPSSSFENDSESGFEGVRTADFKIENGVIYSNHYYLGYKYQIVPDEADLSEEFAYYFAMRLAYEAVSLLNADEAIERSVSQKLFGTNISGDVGARTRAMTAEREKNRGGIPFVGGLEEPTRAPNGLRDSLNQGVGVATAVGANAPTSDT